MSAHLHLRGETRLDHERTDRAFGRFDLADADAYGAFLTAHARVLPPIEAVLNDYALFPFSSRTGALRDDLAALGKPFPEPAAVAPPANAAAAWGMLYVVEGSRLGGAMLARTVGQGLPHFYLDARHAPGGWRRFCDALDAAAEGDIWLGQATEAARATFGLYAQAAAHGDIAKPADGRSTACLAAAPSNARPG